MKFKGNLFKSIQFHIFHSTILHLASKQGNLEIIKLLLMKKGIDINIKDDQGNKPIDYSNNHEIRHLLSK